MIFQIITMAVVTFCLIIILFFEKLVPVFYLVAGFISIVVYFAGSYFIFHLWKNIPARAFEWRLFLFALFIRITAAVALYFFYISETGVPFEYNAVDSLFYHRTAITVSQHLRQFDFNFSSYLSGISFSDQGYNIFLGTIYTFFEPSIITARIINAIFSTLTVLLIYRLTKKMISEHVARIAGVASLLLPNFLLYLGTHLKESVMVFLVMALLYQIVHFVKFQKRNVWVIASLLFLFYALFMFRTVLAAITLASFVAYVFFYAPPKSRIVNIVAAVFLLIGFGYLVFNSQIGNEIGEYLAKRDTAVADNLQYRASRDGGNKFALAAGVPLFLAIIFIAPFPSFVFVPEQDLLWMFISANFIRNIYAFFTLAGIVWLFKKDFRNSSLLLFFAFGYLGVLANSGFAISERFHMPVVPVLLILSSYGMAHAGTRLRKNYYLYLILILLFIIGWNYIKLAGRV